MTGAAAFDLVRPDAHISCAVFSSPHSGRAYTETFVRRTRLDSRMLRRSEDAFVDELFRCAPDYGAPLIAARAPRAYVDLNRSPDELDPAVIAGVRAVGINPRVAAGLGVIPRVVAEGAPIYEGKLSREEAMTRLRLHYRPYHNALTGLLEEARVLHGQAILFDCHSMPSDALRAAPRVAGRRPEIILGDRFGAACAPWVVTHVERLFTDAGFIVCRNAPFAGGFITQRYGRPSHGWHALQIEIDRGLYLDESRMEPSAGFNGLRQALRPVVAGLAQPRPAPDALAAE